MNRREARRSAGEQLAAAGVPDPQIDAELLLEWSCGISLTEYALEPMAELSGAQEERFFEAVRKRCRRIPLQHITGEQEFMGFSFRVNPDVLIPRQDTELLAEEALKRIRPGMRVLDLCTGSGCIIISLELLAREKGLTDEAGCFAGSDISGAALQVARENGRRLGAGTEFLKSDLFAQITGAWDMILSNPPYIRTEVIRGLQEEVRCHEPVLALDGKEDGLYFYRRIIREARTHLKPGGLLLMEIGYDQREAVKGLLEEHGYGEIRAHKDLAGLDRVVIGRYD